MSSQSRTEAVLEAAEALAHLGGWTMELPRGEVVWTNEMYRIHGRDPATPAPDVDEFLTLVHADDVEAIGELLTTVVERPDDIPPDGVTDEYRLVRPDGAVRTIRAHGRVERDADGRAVRWLGAAQDVTEQRLTERELQVHYAVGQALRDWESFEEGVVDLLRRLGTALECALGGLWAWSDERGGLFCRALWSAPELDPGEYVLVTRERVLRPGEEVPGRVWRTGRPLVDPGGEGTGALATELGLRAGIAFPAIGARGPVAALSFYGTDGWPAGERLERTLAGIGRELGRFLEARLADLTPGRLSDREREVLALAADGNTGPQIAERLVVSPSTVKSHFDNVYEKLGVGDRAAAVALALRTGLIR